MLLSYATQSILLVNKEARTKKDYDEETPRRGRSQSRKRGCVFTIGKLFAPTCFPAKKVTSSAPPMPAKFWVRKVLCIHNFLKESDSIQVVGFTY